MKNLSAPSFQTDYSSSKHILNNQSTSSSSTSTSTSTTSTTTTTSTTSTSETNRKTIRSPCKKIRDMKSLKKELFEELLSRDNTTENSVISLSSLENKTNSEFPFLKGSCPLKKKLYSDDLIDIEKKIIDKQLKKKYKKQKCHSHSPQEKLTRPKAVGGIIAISLSPKKKYSDSFSLPDTSKLLKSTDSDKEKLRKLFSGTDLFDSASLTLDKTNTQQEKLLQEVLGSLTESLQEYEKSQELEKSQNSQESQESQEIKQKEQKSNLIESSLPSFVLDEIKTESNNNSKKKSETQSLTTTFTETETPSVEITTTTETIPSEQNPITMFDSVRKILGLQTK